MSKKVLIVSQGSEFMVESLADNLKKNDMEVVIREADPEKIGPEMYDSDICLIYAGEYLNHSQNVLSLICDHCTEETKPICVIGYENDIRVIESFISAQLIAYRFVRPFEMKPVVNKILDLAYVKNEKGVKRSILLVDDDSTFLKTLLKFMEGIYDVTAVRAGQHALKFLESHTPDLVLLDYDMPVLNGPQTLEKIRKMPGKDSIPIVFLTGASDRESVVTAMQLKPEGYLLKNMGKTELLDSVRNFFIALKWKKYR